MHDSRQRFPCLRLSALRRALACFFGQSHLYFTENQLFSCLLSAGLSAVTGSVLRLPAFFREGSGLRRRSATAALQLASNRSHDNLILEHQA